LKKGKERGTNPRAERERERKEGGMGRKVSGDGYKPLICASLMVVRFES
jgi:hypothetical protein